MKLQEYFIERINDFGGLYFFLERIEDKRKYFEDYDPYAVDDIKVFMSTLFLCEVDVETDFILYKYRIIKSTKHFEECYKRSNCGLCLMMFEMQTYALEKVSGIKVLSY